MKNKPEIGKKYVYAPLFGRSDGSPIVTGDVVTIIRKATIDETEKGGYYFVSTQDGRSGIVGYPALKMCP